MPARRLLLSCFPPGFPLKYGLLLGAVAAGFCYYAAATGQLPEDLEPGLVGPLALAGHGLTLAALFTLAGEWLQLLARGGELERMGDGGRPTWAGVALEKCLDEVRFSARWQYLDSLSETGPDGPIRLDLEKSLHQECQDRFAECRDRWTRNLNQRWWRYWALAVLVFVPGLWLGYNGLQESAADLPDFQDLLTPLATAVLRPLDVATLEALALCLAALWVRRGWHQWQQHWVDVAGDLTSQRTSAARLAACSVPAPAIPSANLRTLPAHQAGPSSASVQAPPLPLPSTARAPALNNPTPSSVRVGPPTAGTAPGQKGPAAVPPPPPLPKKPSSPARPPVSDSSDDFAILLAEPSQQFPGPTGPSAPARPPGAAHPANQGDPSKDLMSAPDGPNPPTPAPPPQAPPPLRKARGPKKVPKDDGSEDLLFLPDPNDPTGS